MADKRQLELFPRLPQDTDLLTGQLSRRWWKLIRDGKTTRRLREYVKLIVGEDK